MIGLAFVYDPACAAVLDSGGANGGLFQTTAPVERLSAIAYGGAAAAALTAQVAGSASPSTRAAQRMIALITFPCLKIDATAGFGGRTRMALGPTRCAGCARTGRLI